MRIYLSRRILSLSYYIASVLQCESSYGNKKVFPFAISTTLSLYVASVGQRLALKGKKKKRTKSESVLARG